jgi:hypothetical protein
MNLQPINFAQPEKKTMQSEKGNTPVPARGRLRHFAAALVCMAFLCGFATLQKGFETPEAAVEAFAAAVKADDEVELEAIFGPAAKELIWSGDPVDDRQRREEFTADYELKNRLDREGDTWVLIIGEREWPFPIPLVKQGDRWFFDTEAGKKEILFRRIGKNELDTVQTLLAVVDAQREYAMLDRDGDGIREYAAKFRSDPGTRNGLFWETRPDEAPSPLGQLVADARAGGYTLEGRQQEPSPFNGYYYRMLAEQGPHAAGGAFDYVIDGRQIGGFAVVAYPAAYGNSGVMTFMVSHEGVVYETDFGESTAEIVLEMMAFDPDDAWDPVE